MLVFVASVALMRALESGAPQRLAALAIAAHGGDPNLAMPGLTALLMAEDASHWPCVALLACGGTHRPGTSTCRRTRG